MLAVILLTIGLLAIGVAGISIKLLLKKDGKFSGTCASNNPLINKDGEACGLCGARPEEKCQG
jgi:hypothetical protein